MSLAGEVKNFVPLGKIPEDLQSLPGAVENLVPSAGILKDLVSLASGVEEFVRVLGDGVISAGLLENLVSFDLQRKPLGEKLE